MDTKKNINIFDISIILIATIFVVIFFVNNLSGESSNIRVECNGEIYRYSLDNDQNITLEGAIGPVELEIKDHNASITESPCINQDCVHMGKIHTPNSFIACIPSKVLIVVEKSSSMEVDDVAR